MTEHYDAQVRQQLADAQAANAELRRQFADEHATAVARAQETAHVREQLAQARAERDSFAAGVPLICCDERHEAKVRGLEALLVAGQKATSHWEEAYAREVRAHGVTELTLRAAEAQAAAVRALHERDDSNPLGPWCGTCSCKWPCQSAAALGDGSS